MNINRKWTDKDPREQFNKILDIALTKIGIVVSGQAVELAPVLTGRLKGSITYATRRERSGVIAPATDKDAIKKPTVNDEVWIGTNVEYGPYVEYGTKHSAKQPYLASALRATRKDITKIFKETIGNEYGK